MEYLVLMGGNARGFKKGTLRGIDIDLSEANGYPVGIAFDQGMMVPDWKEFVENFLCKRHYRAWYDKRFTIWHGSNGGWTVQIYSKRSLVIATYYVSMIKESTKQANQAE